MKSQVSRSKERLALATSIALLAASPTDADVFTNVPEAADYQVLYELDIPLDANWSGSTPVAYAVDNSATALPFDRVAYYMELVAPGGNSRWVYASMLYKANRDHGNVSFCCDIYLIVEEFLSMTPQISASSFHFARMKPQPQSISSPKP